MAERTPPEIVADSAAPPLALLAFVAQELEAWGFTVAASAERDRLFVRTVPDGPRFTVRVDLLGEE